MKKIIVTLGYILTLSSGSLVFSAEELHVKTSYSAELKSYNKFNPKKIHKSKVIMSPHGVRVESNDMFIDNNKGLYIQNFKNNKSWVVDTKKKIFSLIKESENKEDDATNSVGGIMATRPCLGPQNRKKAITGQTIVHDEKIIIWSCKDKNNQDIKQGYSQKWSIVVWEHLPNGDISELTGIKEVNYENAFFTPSKKYREVSIKEFYTGAPTLEHYAPKEN